MEKLILLSEQYPILPFVLGLIILFSAGPIHTLYKKTRRWLFEHTKHHTNNNRI